jgi:glucosamine--fructose-6-phosphate aminotransferase (isomerizing)
MTGLEAKGIPASELWLSPKSSYISNGLILLIAISRSGETTETLQACKAFTVNNRGSLITFACYPQSTLTQLGSLNLVFPSGMEKSIAQTRAFTTLLLGVVGLCAIGSNQLEILDQMTAISTVGRNLLKKFYSTAETNGKNLGIDQIYFLGSGPRYGLACELALKMKEMSLTHSEAFHFLEFRHGPKGNRETLMVGLVSEHNFGHEFKVLEEIKELGAQVLTIGEKGTDISFNSGLEEVIRNILYLPIGQMMAYERSIAKGLDPDHPNNLDSVVKLSE